MTSLHSISWQLFGTTLALVAATLAISLPLGTLLSMLLVRTDLAWRRLWLAALSVQLFVPIYVYTAAWDSAFGVTGWFTAWAGGQTVWLSGLRGAIWVHAMAAVPWVALIVGCGLRLVEPELEEDALLHASAGVVLSRVTLRRALPAIGVAGLWVAVTTAGEMSATDQFLVRTYAEEIYTNLSGGAATRDALVGVLPLLVLVGVLVVAGVFVLGRTTPRELPVSLREQPLMALARLRVPLGLLVAIVMLVLVAVPLASLVYKAGIDVVRVESHTERHWSLWKLCERVVGSHVWLGQASPQPEPGVLFRFREEMWWSLKVSVYPATAATLGGLLLAWWMQGSRRRTLPAASALAAALALPGPLVALGLIILLNRRELPWLTTMYDQTLLAPWLALAIRTLPWTTLVLWFALRSLPQDILDSAAVDGAGPFTRLLRIAMPLRWPAVVLAWLVAFVLSVSDLAYTVIVLPPGVETLSVRIFRLMHAAADSEVAAICLAILAGLAALTAGGAGLWSRWPWWHLSLAARR